MRNKFFYLALIGLLIAVPAFAGKLTVNTTEYGQITDIKVLGMENSTKSGLQGVIDGRALFQSDATATTTPVLTLTQTATAAPAIAITCPDSKADNTCTTYSSTTGTQIGTVKITVNGQNRWIRTYSRPD